MKTLNDIKLLINEQMEYCKTLDPRKDKRLLSSGKKKLEFLNGVRLYMETEPNMDYCTLMISNLQSDIEVLKKRMPPDLDPFNTEDKKVITSYNNTSGINKKKAQIKFIQFILK